MTNEFNDISGDLAKFAIERHLSSGGKVRIPSLDLEFIGQPVRDNSLICAICNKDVSGLNCGYFEDLAPYPSRHDGDHIAICGNCFSTHIDPLLNKEPDK